MEELKNQVILTSSGLIYKHLLKNIFFKFDADSVHTKITSFGEDLGNNRNLKKLINYAFNAQYSQLEQNYAGIEFKSPIGLAAGFDYEAKLTQTLQMLGFGFQTIGTITNKSYQGNPKPMLGRLPKSKSLMVNKGFKNPGATSIIAKLSKLNLQIPVGISIGRTNINEIATLKQSIADILHSFIKFEASGIKHSYYELNISCPNLYNDVSFNDIKNLKLLLEQIEILKIKKPIFVKMPISAEDVEIKKMLELISKYSFKGVIFGNLQKNRKNPSLYPEEVAKFQTGNFSGKPTFYRSNELIRLTYKDYKDRFIIIGCGGVFNAKDAFIKITNGATLVQLITGLIYEGPHLVAGINYGLTKILHKKGFKHLSEAIGSNVK